MDKEWSRATFLAHAGTSAAAPATRPHAPPLYQTVHFEYPDAAAAEAAIRGEGYLYGRDGGPADELLAAAVARLEGAEAAVVFSSGMGAISAVLEALLCAGGPGGHLVTVEGLYGTAHELIVSVLPRLGARATLVASATPEAVAAALEPATRAVYVESISNPLLRVADVDGLAALCRERGVPLVVDATFATPLGQRPIARGAAFSVHSATKYIGGHGDALGGVVSGAAADLQAVRRMRKFHGAAPDPFACWLLLRGLRTLELRFARQVENARRLAAALGALPGVVRVHHPSLPSHPDHALAARALDAPGAMIAFEVEGGLDGARRVYDRLRLVSRAASLGDVASLMTHPARFSHAHVDADARRRAGIADGLLRLSVGIEDPDDLLADLGQALG